MKIKDLIKDISQLNPEGDIVSCVLRLNDVTTWKVTHDNPCAVTETSSPVEVFQAFEARELSKKGMAKSIEPIVIFVLEKIKEAAGEGRFSIVHPFDGYKLPFPSNHVESAVMDKLKILGFAAKHHNNPDPGHPASRPYWEVSWNHIP